MKSIPCVLMRGGTSKGAFLLADDLPKDINQRNDFLLSIMGSGHELEIDGIGGGSPQTSKGAILVDLLVKKRTLIICLFRLSSTNGGSIPRRTAVICCVL